MSSWRWADPPSPATSATSPACCATMTSACSCGRRPSEFAARIDELLADPARAEAMGDRARQVARTAYSQDAIADKLEVFYRTTVAARKAGH